MGAYLALLVALAEADRLELAWEAPPECGTDGEVLAAIETLLEGPTARPEPVTAVARITSVAGEYSLTLDIREGAHHQRRELSATSCDELRHAAALIVAITLDPRLGAAPPTPPLELPEPSPVPLDAGATPTGGPAEPASNPGVRAGVRPAVEGAIDPAADRPVEGGPTMPRRSRSALSPPWVGLAASAGVGFGPLPGPAAVASLALSLGGRRWRIELETGPWFPRRATSPMNAVVAAEIWLWTVGARACAEPGWRRLSFPVCAGIDAGPMIGTGRGNLRSSRAMSAWAAFTADLGFIGWVAPRWGVSVRARGHVAIRRPSFDTQPSGDVIHTAGPAGVQALAGVAVRLR